MKDFLIGLLVGAFLTAGTGWYFVVGRNNPVWPMRGTLSMPS